MTAPVTLAVPCWNGAAFLPPLLRSLAAQDPAPARILLGDDASSDGSAEIARRVMGSAFEIVSHGERRGLAATWNHAAELVRTPYFALAHQDDVYEPGFTGALWRALEDDAEAGMAHCQAITIDAAGDQVASPTEGYKLGLWRAAEGADRAGLFRLLQRGNFVVCPAAMYRTVAFARIGGFAPGLRFVPDWDLALRLLLAGWTLASVPRPLVRYRRHGANATHDEVRSLNRYREELQLLREMRERGIGAGWLDQSASLGPALRHNVLYDAFCNLRDGDPAGARAKLEFLRQSAPEESRRPSTRLFRRALAMGAPGRGLLRMGLAAVLLAARVRRR